MTTLNPLDGAYYAAATYYRATGWDPLGILSVIPEHWPYIIGDVNDLSQPAVRSDVLQPYYLGIWRGDILARLTVPGGSLVSVERLAASSPGDMPFTPQEAEEYGGFFFPDEGDPGFRLYMASTQASIKQQYCPMMQARAAFAIPDALTARDSGRITRMQGITHLETLVPPSAAVAVDAWLACHISGSRQGVIELMTNDLVL